jgi:CHRD domain-containing protein
MTPEEPQVAGGVSRRRMLKRIGAGAAVAWTAPILTSVRTPAFAQASPSCHLVTKADGSQETPPNASPGTGTGDFVRTSPTQLTYTYTWQNLIGMGTAAHIHKAPPGTPGPIVVPLSPPSGHSGSVSDVATADAALLDDICANPGAYYLNVHSDVFPGGEIRGQLQSA